MSAFNYYSKISLNNDRKRKRKRKTKEILQTTSLKKLNSESGIDSTRITNDDLNSIYNSNLNDSTVIGQKLLKWLIHPISIDNFMK